jgi:hypothetical protein
MSEIALIKYLFTEDWAPLEEVIDLTSKDFSEIYSVNAQSELLEVLKASPAAMVIACVKGKNELGQLLTVLKNHRKVFKEPNVKVSVINYVDNKNIESALMKLGCQEVLAPTIKTKPLKFKFDFWRKALASTIKKTNDQSFKTKEITQSQDHQTGKKVPEIKMTEPISVTDDMWILKAPQDSKRVLSKWMLKLIGPSPFAAQWMEVEGEKGLWQFVFKEGLRESFHTSDGDWFFRGEQKPEFVWKENKWLITGQNFQMFYQEDDIVVGKFRANTEVFEISKNSEYGLSREQIIIESFDQEILVKKAQENKTKTEIEKDSEQSSGLLVENTSGSEHISGHLKGKIEKEDSDTEDNFLEMESSTEKTRNYSGKSSTDDLGTSHYEGRSKFQSNEQDGLYGESGVDDLGKSKYQGTIKYEKNNKKPKYPANSSTDDLGSSHYDGKSKLESDDLDASNYQGAIKGEKNNKESQSGKSSTDDLGSNHWSNKSEDKLVQEKKKLKPKQSILGDEEVEKENGSDITSEINRSEKEKGDWNDKESGPLSGKSSTNQIGEGHYSNKDTKKSANENSNIKPKQSIWGDEEVERENEIDIPSEIKRSKKEKNDWNDKESGALGGKSSTDQLGASHYSSKAEKLNNSNKEEDGSNIDEKQKVESISSHYGGRIKKKDHENKDRGLKSLQETYVPRIDSGHTSVEKRMQEMDELLPEGERDAASIENNDSSDSLFDFEARKSKHDTKTPNTNNSDEEIDDLVPVSRNTRDISLAESIKKQQVQKPVDDESEISNESSVIKSYIRIISSGDEIIVQVDDFFDNIAIIKLSERSIKVNEEIELVVNLEYKNKKNKVNLRTKCLEVQDNEGECYVTLEVVDEDLPNLNRFIKVYEERQSNIHSFMKAARGY